MRMLLLALLCLLAFPATAWAGQATIVSRDLPVEHARMTAGVASPLRFELVGLHWQGSGHVFFRTRSLAGRWSFWRSAVPEAEDRPDRGNPEAVARRAWRLGNPYWVGASDRLDYRLAGDVRRLRAWFVRSPVERSSERTVSTAGSPQIAPRSAWKAYEDIRRAPPRYAKSLSFAIVHHTAGTSAYRPTTSAAIVRAIELYHVRGNGWNDIGYNFLVDRYGRVFEGRAGGADRNVIGAHAEGFNTGSVGVALIGNYSTSPITPAAERSLAALLAWRLDVAHVDPLGSIDWSSGGNARFRRGTRVRLRAISGHRDTGFTACPGIGLYRKLSGLAPEVAAIGLPKLYTPRVTGGVGGSLRFSARLSAAARWVVTVRDAAGRTVARGAGTSAAVAWTWSAAGSAPGRYAWTIEAGPNTRPAQGTIGRGLAPPALPILSGLALDPPVISPDGDGIADAVTISYTLSGRAAITATVRDPTGAVFATLFADQLQGARRQFFAYAAAGLPDGAYVIAISAVGEDGRSEQLEAPFAVDRTLSVLSVTTQLLTPNGDGLDDSLGIGLTLTVPAAVTVQIEQAGTVVAPVFSGELPAGTSQFVWDGTAPGGLAPSGSYEVAVIANGPFGGTRRGSPFAIAR